MKRRVIRTTPNLAIRRKMLALLDAEIGMYNYLRIRPASALLTLRKLAKQIKA